MDVPNYSDFSGVEAWTGDNWLKRDGPWEDIKWMVVVGSFLAFAVAWGIGANDVANSFATSVGSKAIPMWGAVLLASIFEFVGAISLGGSVSGTIKGDIARPEFFEDNPHIFAYALMASMFASWFWLMTATYCGFAISTTHSIVGALLGAGLVAGGNNAVNWNAPSDEFPYRKGFTPIVISWFLSPALAAIISSTLYFLTRLLVLRSKNSLQRAYWAFPFVTGVTIFIVLLAVFLKGVKEEELAWDQDKKAWVSAIVGGAAMIGLLPTMILMRRRVASDQAREAQQQADVDAEAAHVAAGGEPHKVLTAEELLDRTRFGRFKNSWIGQLPPVKHMLYVMTVDVHANMGKEGREHIADMHAAAEEYDPQTENVFKYVQVATASGVAFVHGANDVANAVGPLGGIWGVYTSYETMDKAPTPRWVLAIGGAGLIIGLSTYGYRMIQVLGTDLVHITPSRGYAVELAGVVIIALASVYGLPVSSTQVITGGELGIGLVDDWRLRQVNWRLFAKTFSGWILTIVVAGLVSAVIFALGIYTPSKVNTDYLSLYQDTMRDEASQYCEDMISTMQCSSEQIPRDADLCQTILSLQSDLNQLFDVKEHINQYDMVYIFQQIAGLHRDVYASSPGTLANSRSIPLP